MFCANSSGGIVIGLSGGIDSAVLATLAVRAVGKERVNAYYLYDRDSSKQSQAMADLIAGWLGIELRHHDITPAMREMRIYSPLVMKITAVSGCMNRFLSNRLNRLLRREPFFVRTLRKGAFDRNRIERFFYEHTLGCVEAAFNARHIYRRRFLEQKSEENNCLLLGAANRSEWMVGWFVKDGVDDLYFSPLIGLYKTQVLQLAKFLGVPEQIRNRRPSPDMVKGITDESALGINYATLDVILYCMDRGMSDEQIISAGVAREDLNRVRTMNRLSVWKRRRGNTGPPSASKT
jgi:NAD+ synthase